MHRFRLHRPSPALVISLIALFVALGGTGYAALTLPKNSVGTKQLKKNAVTAAKIKNNAVTGSKVKDGSLSSADINLATLATVPSANNANHAGAADNATHAGAADNATHAGAADNATNATNASHATNADHASTADSAPFVTTLPTGKTLRGAWDLLYAANAGFTQSGETFAFAPQSVPTGVVIPSGGPNPDPTNCPGSASDPKATSGHFCLYVTNSSNVNTPSICDPTADVCNGSPSRFGFFVQASPASATISGHTVGTWAVTG